MADAGEVLRRLKAFIAATYYRQPGREIGDEEPMISSGLIDSFGLVDLSLFAESEFDVRLDAAELGAGRADTVREIASLIGSKRG